MWRKGMATEAQSDKKHGDSDMGERNGDGDAERATQAGQEEVTLTHMPPGYSATSTVK